MSDLDRYLSTGIRHLCLEPIVEVRSKAQQKLIIFYFRWFAAANFDRNNTLYPYKKQKQESKLYHLMFSDGKGNIPL